MDLREQRKLEHLKHSLEVPSGPLSTGFSDIHLVHQALGCYSLAEIDCTLNLLGKKQRFPLIINAMTGGARGLDVFNKRFALAAKETGIGLAVGSQTAALKNPETRTTFEIVRKVNPEGLIFANVSALTPYRLALEAVEMIKADALQLHLNIAQELAMSEGDRNFQNLVENISILKEKLPVPLIIKEVGFGLSLETIKKLNEIDIKYVDIGGAGGTNFVAIEKVRNKYFSNENLVSWGIPTVISTVEVLSVSQEMEVFSSGGIKSALDILKSLVLGVKAVGMAMPILEIAFNSDERALINYLEDLFNQVKELMLLIGAQNLQEVKTCPIIFTGQVKDWLEVRGININEYAQRKKQRFL